MNFLCRCEELDLSGDESILWKYCRGKGSLDDSTTVRILAGLPRCARNDNRKCHCEELDLSSDEAIQPLCSQSLSIYDVYMGDRYYYVYIMTNIHNTTLYTGVTNKLYRRVQEHKKGKGGKFSRSYNLKKLVFYEVYDDVRAAITREKQIKGGSRMKKLELIEELNPEWRDLTIDYFQT